MDFSKPLIEGRLRKRYKRFLADVELENGELVTAHCANTGAMTGCAEPGMRVWLSKSDNPKRKLKYSWELSQTADQHWIGVNTARANALVAEALAEQKIAPLSAYEQMRSEVKFGDENSRVDFLLQQPDLPDCYLEVKSVTLREGELGQFPDAKTLRGQKHLRELMSMQAQGHQAALLFCVQHTGVARFCAAEHIDPDYARLLREAESAGVWVLVYKCMINQFKISIGEKLSGTK